MASTASYTVNLTSFDMQQALGGVPVTLETSVTESNFKSSVGQVTYEKGANGGINAPYRVIFNADSGINKTYWANEDGIVRKGPDHIGGQLHLVTSLMETTYGTEQDITRGTDSGYKDYADLSNMEPRDQFAIQVLNALITKLDRPESVNDSTILLYSRAAYRWAQGMMIASADARAEVPDEEPSGDTQSLPVDVSTGTNTEKLLNNIIASIDGLKAQSQTNTASNTTAITQLKTAITTALGSTLKIDNPSNDTFEIEGGGGGGGATIINRTDLNDTSTPTDVISYNSASGNAPMRTTLAELITEAISKMTSVQEQNLNTKLVPELTNTHALGIVDAIYNAIDGQRKQNWLAALTQTMSTAQKQTIYDAIKSLIQADFVEKT